MVQLLKPNARCRIEANRLINLLVLILVFLVGCQLKPEYAAAPPAISSRDCLSRPEASRTYSELLAGTLTAEGETIAALGFTGDGQTMFVAYSREPASRGGRLIQIRVSDWQVLRTIELDDLNQRFTRFNGDATLLVTFHQEVCVPGPLLVPPLQRRICYELKVWRTTGEEVIPDRKYTSEDFRAVSLAKSGKWLLILFGGGLDVLDPSKPSNLRMNAIGFDVVENLIQAALNESGNLIAYGTDKKHVRIIGWNGHSLTDVYSIGFGPINYDINQYMELEQVPIKLAIAPNNKWLAIQSAEGLELRDISSGFFPQQAKVSLPRTSAGVLEFNLAGSLLAVGYSQGIRIYSVPDLRLVLDKPGPQTTTLTFSSDGCMLAWGDEQGTVRIISTPKP